MESVSVQCKFMPKSASLSQPIEFIFISVRVKIGILCTERKKSSE